MCVGGSPLTGLSSCGLAPYISVGGSVQFSLRLWGYGCSDGV